MASIAQTRTDLAAILSAVGGMTVRTRPVNQPKGLDGWVNVTRVTPATYSSCEATFTAVLILGADERTAEGLIESLSVPVLNAVTTGPIHPSGVALEPTIIPAGEVSPGALYALILTLTVEVE